MSHVTAKITNPILYFSDEEIYEKLQSGKLYETDQADCWQGHRDEQGHHPKEKDCVTRPG